MSGSFAGSKSVDERRRRRLAAATDDLPTQLEPSPRGGRRIRIDAAESLERRERSGIRFPLRKLISRRPWKVAFFGMLVLAAGGGVVAGGWGAATHPERLGPGFVRLFGLEPGRAVHGFGTFLLLAAAQLSLAIWWVRSRNPRDFGGRYRDWLTAAMTLFGIAAAALTEAHLALGETVAWLSPGRVWKQEILCWLVPLAVCGVILLRTVESEMRRCRAGWLMLWLAVPCWLLAAGLLLDLAFLGQVPHRPLVSAGVVLFGHWAAFMSLLLQARYVIHESADPPVEQASKLRRILDSLAGAIRLPRIPLPSFRLRRAGVVKEEPETAAPKEAKGRRKTDAATAEETEAKSARSKPDRAAARKAPSRAAEPDHIASDAEKEVVEAASAPPLHPAAKPAPAALKAPATAAREQPPKSAVPPAPPAAADSDEEDSAGEGDEDSATVSMDGIDADPSSGLSKRERKRLQKQLRQQQRSHRRAA